jgi:hypothetical protein
MNWPAALPAVQVRVARPTNRLDEVVRFYTEGLRLPVVGGFEDHDGYTGVMIGLPDVRYHLEFTSHREGSPGPAPSADNLLVLYIPDRTAVDTLIEHLGSLGHHPVAAENPYWDANGVTIADPDGWRVVLVASGGLRAASG